MFLTIKNIEKTDKGGWKVVTDHGTFYSKENMSAYQAGFSGEFNTAKADGKRYGYINKPLPPVQVSLDNSGKEQGKPNDNYGVNINACCARAVEIVTSAAKDTYDTQDIVKEVIRITHQLYDEFHGKNETPF